MTEQVKAMLFNEFMEQVRMIRHINAADGSYSKEQWELGRLRARARALHSVLVAYGQDPEFIKGVVGTEMIDQGQWDSLWEPTAASPPCQDPPPAKQVGVRSEPSESMLRLEAALAEMGVDIKALGRRSATPRKGGK